MKDIASPKKHNDLNKYKIETLDNQDVYGALDEEFTADLSQRQRKIMFKNAELQIYLDLDK